MMPFDDVEVPRGLRPLDVVIAWVAGVVFTALLLLLL